jgi:tripartite ATP-independent transporter DctP family solute receptor
VRAVLLCAGFATRLHPVTRDVPKPLLEVGGRPILEDLLEQLLIAGGPWDLTLVSNARFAQAFRRWAEGFAARHPGLALEVLDDGATHDEGRLGAVGDLAFALEGRAPDGPVLVAAGDNLFRFPLGDFLADHAARPRNLILVYREPELARRRRSGVCVLDAAGRVVSFAEKPAEPPSEWCCPPLYVLEPPALARLGEFLDASPGADAPGSFLACFVAADVRSIKLAHGLPVTHPVHRAMVSMSERVAERSEGRLRIDIHPGEQLGSERETLELLQIGSIGMTKVSASVLEGFVPVYAVLGLPYLFRDEAHRFAVLEGEIGRQILGEGASVGLRGLAYYDAGSRSFYSVERPILHPDDLGGLKIRTQESALAMEMVQALGGSATPIAWGELYSALQQGIIDGAENNPPSFHLSRHFEVCRYYALDEHTATPDVLLIGAALWDALGAFERSVLEEEAAASAQLQKRLWREATDEALTQVAAAGVEVLRPDKAAFAVRVADLHASYARRSGFAEWIDAIRETR